MDHNQFWHLVDSTRGQPDRAAKLAEMLAARPTTSSASG
jgi:hypothetical protein